MGLKYYGDGVEIQLEGNSNIFSQLDMQINAIKTLIENLDFTFAQADDTDAEQKTYLVLLDTIGNMLKINMPEFDKEDLPNIEVVNQFLTSILKQGIHKQPEYAELLDQDCGCD